MLQYPPLSSLPTEEDLPETDFQPVDSELQFWVPALLSVLLTRFWQGRTDWFWGVNLGVYYDPEKPAIVPDGFLSLGVEFMPKERGRLSYLIWRENYIPPFLAVEHVSQAYGNEYGRKMEIYTAIGVAYYVIYNPNHWRRDQHQPFEVYRLVDGAYVLQGEEPVWIPEIELGIGRSRGTFKGWTREWLYWFDRNGDRLLIPEEDIARIEQQLGQEQQQAQQERQQAQQERQKRQQLTEQLRSLSPEQLQALGIDPAWLE